MNLTGKTVLITGGRRVGSALALLLADRGANIALTYHTSRETIEATARRVREFGVSARTLQADLSQAAQAQAVVAQTVDTLGKLDVLVNMASIYKRTPFDTLESADFDAMMAANLAAPYHVGVAAGKQMRTQPSEGGLKGKIINIGDWATERPYRNYLPYLVAKGGLTTFTLALAQELAPDITVNMIQPATIDPPPTFSDADRAGVIAATPLGRIGSAEDVNRLILYLLEGTDYATGSCYRVDGGRFLGDGTQGS